MENNFTSEPIKPWYKTIKGLLLAFFLSLIILGALFFTGLFFYYIWQIKYGNAEQLNLQFSSKKFSQSGMLVGSDLSFSEIEMQKYIRDFNPVLGQTTAPVTIIMFVDFECPYCRETYSDFKNISEKYSSVLRIVFKHLPLVDIHPNSAEAALAAACAQEQGKFWPFYDHLFIDRSLSEIGIKQIAEAISLDMDKFNNCWGLNKYQTQVEQDMQDAVSLGVRGTPTYFVNGLKVEGVPTLVEWDKIILQFLNK